jgi:glycerol uptake facilitator-like aquaporin
VGTAALLAVAVAGVILPEQLWALDGGRFYLVSILCAVVVAALAAAGGPPGGPLFNPALSLDAVLRSGLGADRGAAYTGAQIAGACLGTMGSQAAFNLDAVQAPPETALSSAAIAAEFAATFFFVFVIGLLNLKRRNAILRGIIAGLAFFLLNALTPLMSFANPAATVARTLTSNSLGLSTYQAILLVAAQVLGAAVASSVLARWAREKEHRRL